MSFDLLVTFLVAIVLFAYSRLNFCENANLVVCACIVAARLLLAISCPSLNITGLSFARPRQAKTPMGNVKQQIVLCEQKRLRNICGSSRCFGCMIPESQDIIKAINKVV